MTQNAVAENPPTLRERKKVETWNAIHAAAANLALHREIADVTVEAIAREAGVAERTFFNYFLTKADAILGVRAPAHPTLPEDFLDGDGLLQRTAELLLAVTRSGYAEGQAERRSQLFARHPQLLLRRREVSLESEELVQQALAAAMAEHPEWSTGLHGHGVEETARMLTTTAGVPLRYSLMSRGGMPGDPLDQNSLEDMIGLFQDLYRKLT